MAKQLRCLQEIENDMVWRKVPMDRLLCGDVGFGKTEVAIRAIFRYENPISQRSHLNLLTD